MRQHDDGTLHLKQAPGALQFAGPRRLDLQSPTSTASLSRERAVIQTRFLGTVGKRRALPVSLLEPNRSHSAVVRTFSVSVLTGLLDENGLDIADLLENVGLTRDIVRDPTAMISRAQELSIVRYFVSQTRHRRALWKEAGRRYRLLSLNPVGFAEFTSPTLRETIRLIHHFASLRYTLAEYHQIQDSSGNVGLCLSYDGVPEDLASFMRCRDAISITNIFHDLWNGEFPFTRIEIAQSFLDEFDLNFDTPQLSADGATRWFWPADLMDAVPAHADRIMHELYLTQSEALLATSCKKDALLARLESAIMLRLANPSLAQLAKDMGTSRRTLQRELAERGLSLQYLRDKCRLEISRSLLANTSQPIADIAMQLGYSEPSAFHRAFVRWTGQGPRAYRKALGI